MRGAQPGPTLALIAGTHGSEVAPIVALQRVRGALDPATLRGTVLIVHVANMPSFLGRTVYYSPIDGKNLNRVYPGKADGTVSERIAYAITNQIIDRADFLVDIHAGDGNESLRPYTYWSPLGLNPRADSVAREMALAWGNDHIVIDTTRPRDTHASLYTQNTAHLRGKPALTTEAGYLGVAAEEMVQRNVDGVFRLLRYFRMVPGEVTLLKILQQTNNAQVAEQQFYIAFPGGRSVGVFQKVIRNLVRQRLIQCDARGKSVRLTSLGLDRLGGELRAEEMFLKGALETPSMEVQPGEDKTTSPPPK